MRKFILHQRSIYRSFVIEELSISDRVSFSQLFGCVTKNAQTQCQCVGSKFIASKTQETHSRGNTATGYARVLYFIFIRRELGGTGTGCLFQFTCCEYSNIQLRTLSDLINIFFQVY